MASISETDRMLEAAIAGIAQVAKKIAMIPTGLRETGEGGAMAFKVGDVVRLRFGGTLMTVSKLFESPEGREMVQCTPREHRAAFVIDSLETAEQATSRTVQRVRLTD